MRKGLEGRRAQHRLTWSTSSFFRELNCQGADGGFLGCTERGSCAVLCGHGARGAAIYLFGGLDLQGKAHAFVRRFVPTSWGGHWEMCSPMLHARAYATSAVLQCEEDGGGGAGAGAGAGGFVQRFVVCCGISESGECLCSAEVLQVRLEEGEGDLEQELLRLGHWSMIGSLQHPRFLASSLLVNKSVYVIGGFKSNKEPVVAMERLRPSFASFWLRSITDFTRHAPPWKTVEHKDSEEEEEENVIPAHQRSHQESPSSSSFARAPHPSRTLPLFSSYERKEDGLNASPRSFRAGAQTARDPVLSVGSGFGEAGDSQRWWRNRDRCWSGRFRASPPQRIKPFLHPEALQRQGLLLKPAHIKTWDSFQPPAVSPSSLLPSLPFSPPSSPLRRIDQDPPKPVVDHWTAWKRKELARRELVKKQKKEERRRTRQQAEHDREEGKEVEGATTTRRDSFARRGREGRGGGSHVQKPGGGDADGGQGGGREERTEEKQQVASIASSDMSDDKFHYRVLAAKRLQCLYRGHLARAARSKAVQELSTIFSSVTEDHERQVSIPAR